MKFCDLEFDFSGSLNMESPICIWKQTFLLSNINKNWMVSELQCKIQQWLVTWNLSFQGLPTTRVMTPFWKPTYHFLSHLCLWKLVPKVNCFKVSGWLILILTTQNNDKMLIKYLALWPWPLNLQNLCLSCDL